MKLFIIHIAILLALAAGAYAQDQKPEQKPDKAPAAEENKSDEKFKSLKEDEIIENAEEKKFIDRNGDGINDRVQPANRGMGQGKGKGQGQGKGQQMRGRGKDRFIDRNGDGINDNRCKGMGLGNRKQMKRGGGRNK